MAHKYSSPSACGLDQRRRKGSARKVRRPELSAAEIAAIERRVSMIYAKATSSGAQKAADRLNGTLHLRH